VAQPSPADVEHHGAVPPDEQLKGGLVTTRYKAFEELGVG
jgi:hypothetical protein